MPRTSDIDRWFLRRGLPMLLTEERTSGRVWARALPFLIGWYVVALVAPVPADWRSLGADVAIGLVILLLSWWLTNLAAGRRVTAVPDRLGRAELTVFVVGPAVPLLIGDAPALVADDLGTSRPVAAIVLLGGTIVAQVLVLLTVRVVVAYGVLPLGLWLVRELVGSVTATRTALARTLPLLLGVVTFFFFTAEVWQSVGELHHVVYSSVLAVFIGLGAAFVGSKRQLDIDALATFATRADVDAEAAAAVPGAPRTVAPESVPMICPLGRRQRINLRLVAILSRMVVAVVVAVAVGAVFTLLGLLAIDEEVVTAWTLEPPEVLFRWNVAGETLMLGWEHLRVAGFLATFTGFYFAVVSATDPNLRDGMNDTATEVVRQACALRLAAGTPGD